MPFDRNAVAGACDYGYSKPKISAFHSSSRRPVFVWRSTNYRRSSDWFATTRWYCNKFKKSGYSIAQLQPCIEWMTPFAVVVSRNLSIGSRDWAQEQSVRYTFLDSGRPDSVQIDINDRHNIQLHRNAFQLLVRIPLIAFY